MLDLVNRVASDQSTDLFLRPKVDGIDLYGKPYLCEARSASPAGYAFVDRDALGPVHVFTNEQLWAWHDIGVLRFVTRPDAKLAVGAKRSLRRTLLTMNDRERANVLRRLRYCRAIDEAQEGLPRRAKYWQPFCDAVAKDRGEPVQSWKTHYRWWLAWVSAGRDPRVLAGDERTRGNGDPRLDDLQLKAMDAGLAEWLSRKKSRYATAQHAVNAVIVGKLGKGTVDEMIEQGKSPLVGPKPVRARLVALGQGTRIYYRQGPDAARRQMAAVYAPPRADQPLDWVHTDFKFVGVFVIDDETGLTLGTPYLGGAIDDFSGAVVGFDLGFDPPGSAPGSRLLAHTIQRKTFGDLVRRADGTAPVDHDWPVNGVPRNFNLDNDVAFHATHFKAAAHALGCDLKFLEPGSPHKKGMIESFWKSVDQCYLDMFPGKKLQIFDKPGPDIKPENFAVLSLKAMLTFLTKAVVDVHNQSVDGLSGQIRIERYREAARLEPPRPVPAHEDIVELVGCQRWRKATRKGVIMFGLRYNSDELARYRSEFRDDPTVEVRYSPVDIGSVWVLDRKRGVSIRVPCTLRAYATGLTLHQHRVIRRHAITMGEGGRIYRQHLEASKADLYRLGKELFAKKNSRRARQRMAHFFGMSPETLERVTAKTVNPAANKSLLADPADGSGQDEVLDVEPDVVDPRSDRSAAVLADAEVLAAQGGVAQTPRVLSASPEAAEDGPPSDDEDDEDDDEFGEDEVLDDEDDDDPTTDRSAVVAKVDTPAAQDDVPPPRKGPGRPAKPRDGNAGRAPAAAEARVSPAADRGPKAAAPAPAAGEARVSPVAADRGPKTAAPAPAEPAPVRPAGSPSRFGVRPIQVDWNKEDD